MGGRVGACVPCMLGPAPRWGRRDAARLSSRPPAGRPAQSGTRLRGRRARPPQENYFFDGAGQELSSKRVVLRVRFYGGDKKAVLTLKVR